MNESAVVCESRLALNEADVRLVQELETKLQLIRDRVSSVVNCYQTACYLVGRPGSSKTFTVREALEQFDAPWVYQNARMTPMGLFGFLPDHPEHVIVLDDIASLFKSDQAVQILLAALGGSPESPEPSTTSRRTRTTRSSSPVASSPSPMSPCEVTRLQGRWVVA